MAKIYSTNYTNGRLFHVLWLMKSLGNMCMTKIFNYFFMYDNVLKLKMSLKVRPPVCEMKF